MTRSFAVFLAALVAIAVLVVSVWPGPAVGYLPPQWRPLPTLAFSTWPIDPLVRPIHVEPTATPAPVSLHLATPRPTIVAAHSLAGQATWWNSWGSGLYAAAGPRLRSAMGPGYLHRYVTACSRGVCVRVRLITSCACQPNTRLIDLSADAFSRLAPLGVGVLEVEVSW